MATKKRRPRFSKTKTNKQVEAMWLRAMRRFANDMNKSGMVRVTVRGPK